MKTWDTFQLFYVCVERKMLVIAHTVFEMVVKGRNRRLE
jgi:hypothetical protein